MTGLTALAVDDEAPALDELAYLLRADDRVEQVHTATDATAALQLLEQVDIDVVFLDIRMPGLDGMALGRVLRRFARPPALVFVTAYEAAAVDAFALDAVDYLLKPVRAERLAEAVRRTVATTQVRPAAAPEDLSTIPVELGGVTRFVPLTQVRYVEAAGDYARLHTPTGSHLVRIPMQVLEDRWAAVGFVRVHRSYLVATAHVRELRLEPGGGHVVVVGETVLPVSRRHARELKDRLVRRARRELDR